MMKNWKDLIKRWSELGKDILRMLNEWLDIGLGKVTFVRLTNEPVSYTHLTATPPALAALAGP